VEGRNATESGRFGLTQSGASSQPPQCVTGALTREVGTGTTFPLAEFVEEPSTTQNGATPSLKEFHHFHDPIRFDPNFVEGGAKVYEERVEMFVGKSLCPGVNVRGTDLFTGVNDSSTKQHGKEHTLPRKKVRHVGRLKKGAQGLVL
jgi:hypothetical protein